MANIIRTQGGGVPPTMETLYRPVGHRAHGLATAPLTHYEADLHASRRFKVSSVIPHGSEIADNASHDWLVRVGISPAHVTFRASVGGESEMFIYEGTAAAPLGGLLTGISKNRKILGNPTLRVYNNPTVAGGNEGTLLFHWFIYGGGGPHAVGAAQGLTEWILARLQYYLVRITNRSGAAVQASFGLGWSECS